MNDFLEGHVHEQAASGSLSNSSSNDNDIEMTTASNTNETDARVSSNSREGVQRHDNDISPTNPCVLCLTEEKRLACIPCGHLATCVSCGHSLRSCPICRREIDAFVRIYL